MPDFFEGLSATGQGQVPTSANIAPLPEIDFADLPSYVHTPSNVNLGRVGQSVDPFAMKFNPQDFVGRGVPSTIDNRDLVKYRNSSVFDEIGYNKNEDPNLTENKYDKAQPWYESTKNSLVKFGDKTATSFLSFFAQNADTFKSLTNTNLEASWKNEENLLKLKQDQEMENLYPSFHGIEGKKWYSFIPGTTGSGDFYEDFVPQLGFTVGMMAGAIAENFVVGFLTGGAGEYVEIPNTARKIYGAISGFSNLKKGLQIARGITNGNVAVNGLRVGANAWAFYNTAASEASMEAGQNYNETKNELIQAYKLDHGYTPYGADMDKIEKLATGAGSKTFATNLPILLPSNAIQFGNVLFPSWAKARALKVAEEGVEFVVEGTKLESRIAARAAITKSFSETWKTAGTLERSKMIANYFYNPRFAFMSEGFEEASQRAASTAARDDAMKQFYGEQDGIRSIRNGVADIFTDEGVQEFIGGALGGLLFQGTGHLASKFAMPKSFINEKGDKEYKYNFLNKLGIYHPDHIQEQNLDNANKVLEVLNHDALIDVFKEEGFKNLILSGRSGEEMKKYLAKNDIFNVKNIKSDTLNRLLYSALATGKIDLRLQQLNQFGELSDDEFKQALGVDPTQEMKESIAEILKVINERASEFEQSYNNESARFEGFLGQVRSRYKSAKNAFNAHLNTLKTKYAADDPDKIFERINKDRIVLGRKFVEAGNISDPEDRDARQSEILEEIDKYNKDNAEQIEEYDKYTALNALQNRALIDFAAVEEGKKAAIFAFADMNDSAKRAREILTSLKVDSRGMRIDKIEDLLDPNSAKAERKRIAEQIKQFDSLSLTPEFREQKKGYEKQLELLDQLLTEYSKETKTRSLSAADLIHQFLLNDPLIQSNPSFIEWELTDEKKARDLQAIADLTALQKRHQENLNLYNRLVSPTLGSIQFQEHTAGLTKVINDFVERAYQYHKKQEDKTTPVEEAPKKEIKLLGPSTTSTVTEEPIKTDTIKEAEIIGEGDEKSAVDQRLEAIKDKAVAGQALSDDEYLVATTYKVFNDDAKQAYELETKRRNPEGEKKKEVTTEGDITIEGEQPPKDAEIIPVKLLPPSTYIAEPAVPIATEKEAEDKLEKDHLYDDDDGNTPNRTITREVPRLEEKEPQPNIDPTTQWRQDFLDRLAGPLSKEDFSLIVMEDTPDNWEKGSKEYIYLQKNKPGLVVKVVDKLGRDKFDSNYNYSAKGEKIVFSLTSSAQKSDLLELMRSKGLTELPAIKISSVSHGAFPKGPSISGVQLVEGISERDYKLEIAKAKGKAYGEGIGTIWTESRNGYLLRNGGLYINVNESYIKLLPEFHNQIKIEGEVRDVLGLLDAKIVNRELGAAVVEFIQGLLVTNKNDDFNTVMLYPIWHKGQVHIRAKQKTGEKSYKELTLDEIKQNILSNKRMNILDAWLGQTITFYYVENGEVKSIPNVNYNQLVLENTKANKKAHTLEGRKILKPISRFMTLGTPLEQIIAELKQKDSSSQSTEASPEKISPEPVVLTKKFVAEGNNIVLDVDPQSEDALLADARIEKIISTSDSVDTAVKRIGAAGYVFLYGNERTTLNNFIQARIDGKTTQPYAEFRRDTRKYLSNTEKTSVAQERKPLSAEGVTYAKNLLQVLPKYTFAIPTVNATLLNVALSVLEGRLSEDEIKKAFEDKNKDLLIQAVQDELANKPIKAAPAPTVTTPTIPDVKYSDKEAPSAPDINLDRKKTEDQTRLMGKEEVKFLVDRFGEARVRQLMNIVDANAWGTWTRAGITLYADAVAGTGYHEAWHEFSQLYLTREERKALYDDVRRREGMENAPDIEIEEHLANDFMKYVQSDGKEILGKTVKTGIFKQILDFLRWLFGVQDRIEQIYSDLYSGNFQNYKPSINNAEFGKLNSRIVKEDGDEILPPTRATRYIRYMDSLMGQFMDANPGYSFSHFNIKRKIKHPKTGKEASVAAVSIQAVKQFMLFKFKQTRDNIALTERAFIEKNGRASELSEVYQDMDMLIDNFRDTFASYFRMSDFNLQNLSKKDLDEALALEEVEDKATSEGNDVTVESQEAKESNYASNSDPFNLNGGNSVSLINAASSNTKSLIRTLSKVAVDPEGNPKVENGKVVLATNEFGLNEPVNFAQVFNNLGIMLEGSYDITEMMERLFDPTNQKKIPEIALLLQRLKVTQDKNRNVLINSNNVVPYVALEMFTSFYQDFGKVYIPIYSLLARPDGSYSFKEETKRTKEVIQKQWNNNFANINPENSLATEGWVLFDENKRPFLNVDRFTSLEKMDAKRPEDVQMLFSLLGIKFSPAAIESPEYAELIQSGDLNFLLKSLRARFKAQDKISKPVTDLGKKSPTSGIFSEATTMNKLIDIEVKYTNIVPSMSYRTAEGTMQYGLSLNMWLATNNYWLSKTLNYDYIKQNKATQHLNIQNNPYIKNSLWLNSLFNLDESSRTYGSRNDIQGKPVVLEFGNYNGLKYEDNSKPPHSTTNLSVRDKIIMDVNSLLSNGAVEIMRTESSASAFFLRLNNYAKSGTKKQFLPLETRTIGSDIDHVELRKIMRGYFEDEFNTAINKFNSTLPGYHDAKVGPGRLSMFAGILYETRLDKTNKEKDKLQTEIEDLIIANRSTGIEPGAKQMLTNQVLAKYGKQIEDRSIKFLQQQAAEFKAFLKNKQLERTDFSEALMLKDDQGKSVRVFNMNEIVNSFVVNDFILNVEFSKLFSGDVAFYKAYHKRSKGDVSTGKRMLVDPIVDNYLRNTHSKTLAYSLGVTEPYDLETTKTATIKDDERASVYEDHLIQAVMDINGISKEQAQKILLGSGKNKTKYADMNVADGQGHCTLDFYRSFRIAISNWTADDERMYEKEVLQYRIRKNLYEGSETLPEGQREADEAKLKDLEDAVQVYWPPIKMQHNGNLDQPGTFAPVLDKFSIAPLIPSVIAGTKWDTVHDGIVKSGVQYTKMKSGSKKYQFPAVNFYDENYNATLDIEPEKVATVFSVNLKEQINTKGKLKKESTWGTQMRKLFMANLFSVGATSEKFSKIFTMYKDIMKKMVAGEKAALYKEFGITESEGKLIITDHKNFVQTIQEQAAGRKMNDNILNSIGYNAATKGFMYPLEINLNKPAVQDLIMGMIYSRLTRIKLNGDMLIQVASTGFENDNTIPRFSIPNKKAIISSLEKSIEKEKQKLISIYADESLSETRKEDKAFYSNMVISAWEETIKQIERTGKVNATQLLDKLKEGNNISDKEGVVVNELGENHVVKYGVLLDKVIDIIEASTKVNSPRIHPFTEIGFANGSINAVATKAKGSPLKVESNTVKTAKTLSAKEKENLYSDLMQMENADLDIDPSKPNNFYYEKGQGIHFIDLGVTPKKSGSSIPFFLDNFFENTSYAEFKEYKASNSKLTNATKKDELKYGTNGLRFYTMEYKDGKPYRTKSMQVKVALAGNWTNLLNASDLKGKKIETIERLNELLKDEAWMKENRKLVTMIGYRIPTQGPNSMEVMEVAEFLPPIAGNIVILPAEIVVKAGSDYDIDKMNIFRPSVNKKGQYISDKTYEDSEQELAQLEESIARMTKRSQAFDKLLKHVDKIQLEDEEDDTDYMDEDVKAYNEEINARERELIEQYHDLVSSRKPFYTNKLIEMYTEVLSSPEMFTQLITPNNTELIRDLAVDLAAQQSMNIKDYADTDILKYLSNLSKFDQLLSGKKMLGVFALGNNMSQLLQQSGMTLNSSYNIKIRMPKNAPRKTLKRALRPLLLSPDERKTVVTTTNSGIERKGLLKTDEIITKSEVKANKDILYIFGDNNIRKGLGGQAKEMRGESNAMGISTKKLPDTKDASYMNDKELDKNRKIITDDVNKIIDEWNKGVYKAVKLPPIGIGLAKLQEKAPETWKHLQEELDRMETEINKSKVRPIISFTLDFSSSRNVEGKYKQDYFSQLINSTVDIASDPYFVGFGINDENVGVFVYLLHMGVPFDRAVYFINQPVLRRYYDMVSVNPDPKVKPSFKKLAMGEGEFMGGEQFHVIMEQTEGSNGDEFYFSTETLKGYVEDSNKITHTTYMQNLANGPNKDYQKIVAAHFFKLQEQAAALRDLQNTTNFDTKKFLSPINVEMNLRGRNAVRSTNLFNPVAVNKIMNDSLISAFNNLEITKQVFKTIMPVGNSSSFLEVAAHVLEEFTGSKSERLRVERILANDWIEFIIKNFARIGDQNFEDYARPLIEGNSTLAQDLYALKNTYPELSEKYQLVRILYPMYSEISRNKNIELERGLDNTTDFQNILIEEYNNLLKFNGSEIPGRVYTPQETAQIRNFFKRLQVVAFQQSGFNRSPFSFVDIVPHQDLSKIFNKALERFDQMLSLPEEDRQVDPNKKPFESLVARRFYNLFRRENAKTLKLDHDMEPEGNPKPSEGKVYKHGSIVDRLGVPLPEDQQINSADEDFYAMWNCKKPK